MHSSLHLSPVAPAQLPTTAMDDLSFGMASPILGCPNGTFQNYLSDQGLPGMIPELGRLRPGLMPDAAPSTMTGGSSHVAASIAFQDRALRQHLSRRDAGAQPGLGV